jgi:hypothetical protein
MHNLLHPFLKLIISYIKYIVILCLLSLSPQILTLKILNPTLDKELD